jgi:hypothetical protein
MLDIAGRQKYCSPLIGPLPPWIEFGRESLRNRLAYIQKPAICCVGFHLHIFAVRTLVYFSSSFTSAARAYVQGEGTWSKNQKQATIRLQEYSASHDEKDYQAFLDSFSVQLVDRIAREQRGKKPEPDYAAIHAGFRQGQVAEVRARFSEDSERQKRSTLRLAVDHGRRLYRGIARSGSAVARSVHG